MRVSDMYALPSHFCQDTGSSPRDKKGWPLENAGPASDIKWAGD
jgi:hypothetical protein